MSNFIDQCIYLAKNARYEDPKTAAAIREIIIPDLTAALLSYQEAYNLLVTDDHKKSWIDAGMVDRENELKEAILIAEQNLKNIEQPKEH